MPGGVLEWNLVRFADDRFESSLNLSLMDINELSILAISIIRSSLGQCTKLAGSVFILLSPIL